MPQSDFSSSSCLTDVKIGFLNVSMIHQAKSMAVVSEDVKYVGSALTEGSRGWARTGHRYREHATLQRLLQCSTVPILRPLQTMLKPS